VRRSVRFGDARLFSRWYRDLGKHVVVVVVSEIGGRNWIATAYIARRLAEGGTEWQRS
jgi:dienelactone hydrolase